MSYSVYLPNYSIGENCYKELPYVARNYGKKAVVIGGKTAMEKTKDALLEGIKGSDLEITDFIWYGGDSSYENGNALIANPTVRNADIIIRSLLIIPSSIPLLLRILLTTSSGPESATHSPKNVRLFFPAKVST